MKTKGARPHLGAALVVAIPFVIALTNRLWLSNGIGDVDVWLYNGYFKALGAFAANREAWGPPLYFETRLPILVPGAVVYACFSSDAVARIALNLCILHGIIAGSFWYVLRTHVSRPAATAATALLVTDIFYLRTIGWDYIDNAILAYQALSFALLASLVGRRERRLRLCAVGFTAMSMLTVNLGSAIIVPVLATYAVFVIDPTPSLRALLKRLGPLVAFTAIGAAACLVFYGTISRLLLHGPFAYWMGQLEGGQRINVGSFSASLPELWRSGFWLVPHGAALVAVVVALLHRMVRRSAPPLTPLARFCFYATLVAYALLVIGEGLKRSFFLSRSGVYASHWLFLTYLTLGVLLFGHFEEKRRTDTILSYVAIGLCAVAAVVKLTLHDGEGLAVRFPQPMFVLAIAYAVAAHVAYSTKRPPAVLASLVVIVAASMLVPWRFDRDDSIIEARNFILESRAPPRVFYAESDPQRPVFVSIASALTDHVVHDHYEWSARPLLPGERIMVLESALPIHGEQAAPCVIDGLAHRGSRRFQRRNFAIDVHRFEVLVTTPSANAHCAARADDGAARARLLRFEGPALHLLVGSPTPTGDAVVAAEPTAPDGWLFYGPTFPLGPGVFDVTFHYVATSRPGLAHHYEIWTFVGNDKAFLGGGELADTAGKPGAQSMKFRLTRAMDLDPAVYFSGAGELSLSAITVDQVP